MLTGYPPNFLDEFVQWAEHQAAIKVVVLFGSRVRQERTVNCADQWSDYDIQVVTNRVQIFGSRTWTNCFSGQELLAFAVRRLPEKRVKITAVFKTGLEVDIVVIPFYRMLMARVAVTIGLHRFIGSFQRALDELAFIMRPGFRVLKGGQGWENFYTAVISEVRGTRLVDIDVVALAEEFVCDFLWAKQKICRGELIAAQRMLHQSLAEINFKLLHEARMRKGQITFQSARRLEGYMPAEELRSVTIDCRLEEKSLLETINKSAKTCQKLVQSLVGDNWRWPLKEREPLPIKSYPELGRSGP